MNNNGATSILWNETSIVKLIITFITRKAIKPILYSIDNFT